MTDIDIMERVERATAFTRAQTVGIEATREQERVAFEARKRQITEVAHRLGNRNGIGRALDDLLDEFGLPRRGHRNAVRAQVVVYLSVVPSQRVNLDERHNLFLNEGSRVTNARIWSDTVSGLDGEPDCTCSHAQDAIMRWVRDAWGTEVASKTLLQIGATYCGGDDCTASRDTVTEPTGPLLDVPIIAWSDPDAVPSVQGEVSQPVTAEPQEGQTWYMTGDRLYGTDCTEGEGVVITTVGFGGSSFHVRRVNGGNTWGLRREHIRNTP